MTKAPPIPPKPARGPYTGEWYDDRNERRKQRYHNDPDYRADANKSARDGYRRAAGAKEPFDPRQNEHMLETGDTCVGKLREIQGRSGVGHVLTFTKGELAVVFNRPTKQLQQWSADGRIPSAMIQGRALSNGERAYIDVYTQAEARAIVTALGPFLADLIYFRLDHAEAINAVRAALLKVRKATTARSTTK